MALKMPESTELPPHNEECEICLNRGLAMNTINTTLKAIIDQLNNMEQDIRKIAEFVDRTMDHGKRIKDLEDRMKDFESLRDKAEGAAWMVKIIWTLSGALITALILHFVGK